MPEQFFSRLARSTYLSKNRIAFRLSGAPSVQNGIFRNAGEAPAPHKKPSVLETC